MEIENKIKQLEQAIIRVTELANAAREMNSLLIKRTRTGDNNLKDFNQGEILLLTQLKKERCELLLLNAIEKEVTESYPEDNLAIAEYQLKVESAKLKYLSILEIEAKTEWHAYIQQHGDMTSTYHRTICEWLQAKINTQKDLVKMAELRVYIENDLKLEEGV